MMPSDATGVLTYPIEVSQVMSMAGSHGTALGSTRVGSTGARIAVGSTGAGTGAGTGVGTGVGTGAGTGVGTGAGVGTETGAGTGTGVGVEITLFMLELILVLELVLVLELEIELVSTDPGVVSVLVVDDEVETVLGVTTAAAVVVSGTTAGFTVTGVIDADCAELVVDADADDDKLVVVDEAADVVDALDAAVVVSTVGVTGVGVG